MPEKVIITERGGSYHLPASPHFKDGAEALCSYVRDVSTSSVSLDTARRKGYTTICQYCQAKENSQRRQQRKDSLPTLKEAVERRRRLRRGGES